MHGIEERKLCQRQGRDAHEETRASAKGHEQIDHTELDIPPESHLGRDSLNPQTMSLSWPMDPLSAL